MQEQAYHAKRMAQGDEDRLCVLHPDKRFDEEGPVAEWQTAWVSSGWSDGRGNIRMPRRLSDVAHAHATLSASSWAWHIPTWLRTFLRWRSGRCLARQALLATHPADVIALPDDIVTTSNATATAHEGACVPPSYANEGGTQKGGFGFAAVTGGDGDADTHARELMRAWGPVTTCKHSPTWIGATGHTNNTAELTALAELMRWLIDDGPSPQHRVLLRPDIEYDTPQENLELARVVRALYRC
eukprot:335014-Prymnesium_polylepis.1